MIVFSDKIKYFISRANKTTNKTAELSKHSVNKNCVSKPLLFNIE